ncbi:hypothetical protein Tco_0659415 [Tanacetum coccineum]
MTTPRPTLFPATTPRTGVLVPFVIIYDSDDKITTLPVRPAPPSSDRIPALHGYPLESGDDLSEEDLSETVESLRTQTASTSVATEQPLIDGELHHYPPVTHYFHQRYHHHPSPEIPIYVEDGDNVKYTACIMLDGALTWWNLYVRTVELALLRPEMATPKARMIERYIGGLSQNIKGNVRRLLITKGSGKGIITTTTTTTTTTIRTNVMKNQILNNQGGVNQTELDQLVTQHVADALTAMEANQSIT